MSTGQPAEAETFSDISNERQWEWDREIEILRDFIDSKGLDAEMIRYARTVADQERADEEAEEARIEAAIEAAEQERQRQNATRKGQA